MNPNSLTRAKVERDDDEPDVGTFRRFNGADPAVVGGVHVPHLKPGPLPGQTTGSQGAQTALMGDFTQGVGLIHELGELGGPEKLFDHRLHRLGVHQVMRHQGVQVLDGHAFFDGPLHPDQPHPELVLQQLAHGPDPAVTQVVDVVHGSFPVFLGDEFPHRQEDVLPLQGGLGQGQPVRGVGPAVSGPA